MINKVFVSIAVPFLSLIHAARQNVCACRSWMFFYIGRIGAFIGSETTQIAPVNLVRLRWPFLSIARRNDQKIDLRRLLATLASRAAIFGLELQRCLGVVFQARGERGVGEGVAGIGGHIHVQDPHPSTRPWANALEQGTTRRPRPLKPKEVWNIRARLQIEARTRALAIFNLAIDSKLRGCDLVNLKIDDLCIAGRLRDREMIILKKTGRPVQFEITEQTRVEDWLAILKIRDGRFACAKGTGGASIGLQAYRPPRVSGGLISERSDA
jgi:hypothetical protein